MVIVVSPKLPKIPFNMPVRFRLTSVMVRVDLKREESDRNFYGTRTFILK
ncbi:hypothetical protein [Leptolyngbya sp. NIES-2104]|nr:hypothetical protein [Leptolyngbya sp. NIES-2104]GAP93935.1 hypothetical protein NIES2104_04440 [Leptolyngbya sp. NIES-2104]